MFRIKHFISTGGIALVVAAYAGTALAENADTADAAGKTAQAIPTKAALVTLEKSAYEAWKAKNAKFWGTFLSDNFVGWGSSGRLDKAAAIKEYTGSDCEIRSYAVSDEQVSPLGKDAALITHKATVDGTCNGQTLPAGSWVASIYVRDGNQWKGVFHAEAPVVDPKATPAEPVDQKEASHGEQPGPAHRDAGTDAMLTAEEAVWEAWRRHDAEKLADLTARNISFINIFGIHLATKADTLNEWSGTYCNVRSVSISDAAGTMLSPTVGILTHRATADGTCYGQKVGPVWGTSVYIKQGGRWKWTFGINLAARREGA